MSEIENFTDYMEVKLLVSKAEYLDILLAELAEIGYESFTEHTNGLDGYIETHLFATAQLDEIIKRYSNVPITYSYRKMETKNWNSEWEKNFEPVEITDKCRVRATFHRPDPNYVYDIIIDPKMSFGTGHHETTALVLSNQIEIDFIYKKVLDIGCGTGILAILASKMGASKISAFDNNPWCYENTKDNIELNGVENIELQLGTIESVQLNPVYDIVLANITKNVILSEIDKYVQYLNKGGYMILSGFFEYDLDQLFEKTELLGLTYLYHKSKNNWVSPVFIK